MVAPVPYIFALLRGKLRAALLDANFAYVIAQIGAGGLQQALISASQDAAVFTQYWVRTSVAAISLVLPALSSLNEGDWLVIADVDFNANANNITVLATGSDTIVLYDTTAGSQLLTISGVKVTLVVNSGKWRMLVG